MKLSHETVTIELKNGTVVHGTITGKFGCCYERHKCYILTLNCLKSEELSLNTNIKNMNIKMMVMNAVPATTHKR